MTSPRICLPPGQGDFSSLLPATFAADSCPLMFHSSAHQAAPRSDGTAGGVFRRVLSIILRHTREWLHPGRAGRLGGDSGVPAFAVSPSLKKSGCPRATAFFFVSPRLPRSSLLSFHLLCLPSPLFSNFAPHIPVPPTAPSGLFLTTLP